MKIYCRCLRPDIEYKTLVINYQTSCKELIMMLLNKAKMKHRDPKLFYLTMEVGVRKSGTISNTKKFDNKCESKKLRRKKGEKK